MGEWSYYRGGQFKGGMDEWCFRPLLCTVKAELGWVMLWRLSLMGGNGVMLQRRSV